MRESEGLKIDWWRTAVTLVIFSFVVELWRFLGMLGPYQSWISSYSDATQTIVWIIASARNHPRCRNQLPIRGEVCIA